MNRYSGLCCGGPLDGQSLVSASKRYELVVRVETEGRQRFREILGGPTYRTDAYNFVAGFWVYRKGDE